MNLKELKYTNENAQLVNGFRYIISSLFIVLLCFFVMLISISDYNPQKSLNVAAEMRKEFSYNYSENNPKNNQSIKTEGDFAYIRDKLIEIFNDNEIIFFTSDSNTLQAEIPTTFLRSNSFENSIIQAIKNTQKPANTINIEFAVPYLNEQELSQAIKIATALENNNKTKLLNQNYKIKGLVYYSQKYKSTIKFIISNETRL